MEGAARAAAATPPEPVTEVIRVRDQYYILATSALADDRMRVLKHGETFAVFDLHADLRRLGRGEQGLYHKGTRYLSRSVLHLGEERPILLGSTVSEDNVLLAVDLTNPDLTTGNGTFLPGGALHIFRSLFLWEGVSYERLRVFNYADTEVEVDLTLEFGADFADIFEVRGMSRERRGTLHEPESSSNSILVRYEGLDGVERRTRIEVTPEGEADGSEIRLHAALPVQAPKEFFISIGCEEGDERPPRDPHEVAIVVRRDAQRRLAGEPCRISTSSEQFNAWVERSLADLQMMITDTPHGPYPYAGVPWFSTPFGRDGLITAYELLWMTPSIARGVLGYLAATQARESDPVRESEPGKILHEQRTGEMAALGEVPFGLYYGSVDSTPLFVALAGEYLASTGDLEFTEAIWPNVLAALEWIDRYGDLDGDGFIEYRGSTGRGLVQQGWKDSHDAVCHRDGTIPSGPIALCEVQGYVYWAKQRAADMAAALDEGDRAQELTKQAARLRDEFDQAFWSTDLGIYVLALDGQKRPCDVRASNAGQCLLSGIVPPEKAKQMAEQLVSDEFFSGWGIRTLATGERRYAPISYHNGSVWPHDNALIAQGFANYGMNEPVHRVMNALFDASVAFEFHRLPELFCGFPRRPGQGPIWYPLACAPQAWASASVFMLLRACLGLEIDASAGQVRLSYPTLPPFLNEVRIEGLRCGTASLDLTLHRYPDDVAVNVSRREGDVEVVTVK